MNFLLVFDADNTLWDTNDVFRRAQLDMLEVLERGGLFTDSEAQFGILRAIDRELFSRIGRFEYDFRLLSAALIYYYSRSMTVEEAVHEAISPFTEASNSESALIDESFVTLKDGLLRVPSLFPDTEPVLSLIQSFRLKKREVAMVLFSDGDLVRLERIHSSHRIREHGFFDEVMVMTKSREALEEVKSAGLGHLSNGQGGAQPRLLLIGDSLKRDIKLGNQAGFITVYKPAGFLGQELPSEFDEQPNYTISRLNELLPILRKLGLPI